MTWFASQDSLSVHVLQVLDRAGVGHAVYRHEGEQLAGGGGTGVCRVAQLYHVARPPAGAGAASLLGNKPR